MLAKKFGPSRALPVMMFTFGSMTLLTASAKNFSGIFALRWFLGMAESAFFPTVRNVASHHVVGMLIKG